MVEKKNLASILSRSERSDLVEWDKPEFSIEVQADLLSLNRTGLYYRPVPPSPEELAIKRLIDEIYTAHPFLGSRRITVLLKRKDWEVNRKRIQGYMQEMGIAGICPKRNLSKENTEHLRSPYLLPGLEITYPNQAWGIEEVYLKDYESPRDARKGIREYLTFYNTERPHQSLGDKTPKEVYQGKQDLWKGMQGPQIR